MSGLFQELKRRNVIRVALAYLVLSWLLLQVGDVLFEALRLDDAALTVMLVILALGFIPVVIIAWVYELTPEGVKRESEIARDASVASHTGERLNVAIVVLLVAALGLFVWDRLAGSPTNDAAQSEQQVADDALAPVGQSIAVLPFADMSTDGDQAYFGDGIAEELLNVLASVDGLKVAARTSSFKFRGEALDIPEIGRALDVTTILEGSVRKAGDQVRITAQLIDVNGGYHLWSQSYDRKLDNIFDVQDEIARSIVDALKLQLQLGPAAVSNDTESGRAYDLYLRGREYAREPSKAGLERALGYYQEALAVDPDLAAVHGAIASVWVWLEDYGGIQSQEAFDRAERAARRALEIDPNRAEALTSMGFVEDRKYGNNLAAREYYERALSVNPAYTDAATLYADALADLGETNNSLQLRREAVERDPLSGFLKSRLASQLIAIGQDEEGVQLLREILALNPGDTYGQEEMANYKVGQGLFAEAIEYYKKVHENRPGDPYAAANISTVFSVMGDTQSATEWIAAARERGANNRWELSARRALAKETADWDAMFRAGQLNLIKDGVEWQGYASLGEGDWEAARAAYQRVLSRLQYRPDEQPNGDMLQSLLGLTLAEQRLGVETWEEHAGVARALAEKLLQESDFLRSWPRMSIRYILACLSAIEGDADAVVEHMQASLAVNYLTPRFLEHDPFLRGYADDPRLQALAAEMRARTDAELAKTGD